MAKTKQITEEQFEKLANKLLELNEKEFSFLDRFDGCSLEQYVDVDNDGEEFEAQLAEPNHDDTIYLITTQGRTKVSIFVKEAYNSGWFGEEFDIGLNRKELLSNLSSEFDDAVSDHLN